METTTRPGPNDVIGCPSESAWRRHLAHAEECETCAVWAVDSRLAETEPKCTKTHDEHMATWRSWRDDCDPCHFYMRDVEQCEADHPDDGVDWCGACGFER